MASAGVGRFQATHWALVGGVAIACGSADLVSPTSVVAGGAVAGALTAANAIAFRTAVRQRRAGVAFGLLGAKTALLLGLGWLAFAARPEYRPDPAGFAVGVTCLPLAALVEAWRARRT